jgi:hypothetical protein
MLLTALALFAIQVDKPAANTAAPERDVYTSCFLGELSSLEGHDVTDSHVGR